MITDIAESIDAVWHTPFGKALRWRVHDADEARSIAASHRRQAAEARDAIPFRATEFRARGQAAGLEHRALRHDEIAKVCEQHATNLMKLTRAEEA
jgi:hypothetical protein